MKNPNRNAKGKIGSDFLLKFIKAVKKHGIFT